MATYIGFSTIGSNIPKSVNMPISINGGVGGILRPINFGKKFRLVDENLILQDFINSLNIRKGEKVGQPDYGTNIWSYAFEPNTQDVHQKLKTEVEHVASLDPRLKLTNIHVYTSEHGILVQADISLVPFTSIEQLQVYFDAQTRVASRYTT